MFIGQQSRDKELSWKEKGKSNETTKTVFRTLTYVHPDEDLKDKTN